MVSALLSRCLILILGTLYPAYRSYKAIKNKVYKEHVKWMMYWIVFALFTAVETFLDVFVSWFPFYYEIKILFILWVLSPATRGSSLLYRKVVHPLLCSREKEIDEFIEKTKQQGYATFLNAFSSGFQYASTLFVTSALKGQILLENQLRKSLSMNDISNNSNNNRNSNNNNNNGANAIDQTDSNNGGVVFMKKTTQIIVEEDNEYDEDLENRIREDEEFLNAKKNNLNKDTNDNSSITDLTNTLEASNDIKKRHSRRAAAAASSSSTTSSSNKQSSIYKSTEASHYGTISRVKKPTKHKSKQATPTIESDT